MTINWFPGHMAKTRRQIQESLKLVDAVIEIRDARIVKSSANPQIDEICKDKPRVILLNKSDLAEDKVTKEWIKNLTTDTVKPLAVNSITGEGLKSIKPILDELLKEKQDRQRKKGLVNIVTRVMVVGIPNVGKSSFINKLAKNNIAKTGDRPGVTKSKQWIKTSLGIELMDTPGVLWPRFEDEEVGLNLAFTGAIKDEIMDIEELALRLIERLQTNNSQRLMERYKLSEIMENPLDNMDNIGKKRGAVISGGNIDYNRIAVMLLDEFRGGKLGAISLERVK
ncbi:ribosome biogenesis GTPase YlqF [Clostridium tagluense]|uniref:ribosome biogenesis GTPase YlqF n=1 Tax=Clostridium TaxID=1485 RepID=UPI0013E995AA|nr:MULTISPECIES: ribosome biogenesis GTPase YlqF [Clostridium]MBU3126489.1 ribosome biogenesis GTPase YlqF [Clostridium tagluense]MBW9156391.1 ribosome biogenesis GTPase YlqF [Clostridium tagluense]MBZ9624320.1 ribosome biogenesis GTPase YlqF [Clostridium sp. FP2]MCB2299799.1 ribosome biogenesis GTPase YlqF [Clostridium tagluense]MCB2309857.1 ribosome biogenesis GTPase YlqF [Clostridium tagluense]